MKVFLSHSSKDKGFVEPLAGLLRPGTYELDSETFDAGLLNSQAITAALNRSDLFCLFLSENSINSAYVEFETLLGLDFLASGKVVRFLVICLDDAAFQQASANVKYYNIIRKGLKPDSAARIIQGHMISAAEQSATIAHPFMGREDELIELEKQVSDHKRPPSRALFISGNFGSGRKTIAHHFYEDQYPSVGRNFPTINIEQFTGLEELYRRVITVLRPAMAASELKTRVVGFSIASSAEKRRLIAEQLNSLLLANEASLLIDKGGILDDSGALSEEINAIVSGLDARPHPPVVVIAPRMIPLKLRRAEDDMSYLAVRSLKREAAERLIKKLARDAGVILTDTSLAQLVKLSDFHAFNIYRMMDEIRERGVEPFLANPRDFIDWVHRQSSDYIKKIKFSSQEALILGLLKQLPELDFTAIVGALNVEPNTASEDLLRLVNLHVVETASGTFTVSPALRIAVERDRRLRLNSDQQRNAIRNLATSLSVRIEEGTAPISLVDAAVLSSLDSGQEVSEFAAVFLLPSHHVWLAKWHYDQRNWDGSMRFAADALKGGARLSVGGYVAAGRYLCLAAARLGEGAIFDDGIKKLEEVAKDDWAKSNIAFLRGFNLRLKGNLPEAEVSFRDSYRLSPGNLSASREVASIALARDNLDEAEHFAREAHSHAPTNPYVLDILISVLVRKHGRSAKHHSEITDLFDMLEKVGEEDGRSFFTTRKAELEHLWGNNREALRLILEAVKSTPTIFEPRRLHAEILLKEGNKVKALETLDEMHRMVNARDPRERRTNYRLYLKTQSHYLVEVGRYREAKEIFDDRSAFTEEEKRAAIRDIEIVQGFKGK